MCQPLRVIATGRTTAQQGKPNVAVPAGCRTVLAGDDPYGWGGPRRGAAPVADRARQELAQDGVMRAWFCGSLLALPADERWPHLAGRGFMLGEFGPTARLPGRGWPLLDRCQFCRQRGAGQRGAPAAKQGRATLTGDQWRPSPATRWGQNPSTISVSKIVNWGRNSPVGGARTHPRSQRARYGAAPDRYLGGVS